jgi:NitT/TauT family transport system substrate-binding protein
MSSYILRVFLLLIFAAGVDAQEKQAIKAIYIPLADHYAALVAYEKYRDGMTHADYSIERMRSWPDLRAYFMSGEVDVGRLRWSEWMAMSNCLANLRCCS